MDFEQKIEGLWTGYSKGNENVKKNNGFIVAKQQLSRLFCTFQLPSLHDYDVKMPIFTFYGGHKQATTNFSSISPSKRQCSPHWNQLQLNSPTFDIFSELE